MLLAHLFKTVDYFDDVREVLPAEPTVEEVLASEPHVSCSQIRTSG